MKHMKTKNEKAVKTNCINNNIKYELIKQSNFKKQSPG